jgi:hypothetical protein
MGPAASGRRTFVRSMIAGAATIAVGCDGVMTMVGGDAGTSGDGGVGPGGDRDAAGAADGPSANRAPIWTTVPPLTFIQGIASSISIAAYVTDPDGDALSVMLDDTPLPPGVTYDAAGLRFVYDGIGAIASTEGHVLTADDGRG